MTPKLRPLFLALGWAYAGLIAFLSLTPSPPHVLEFDFGDKVKHLLGYALLMAWFAWLYPRPGPRRAYALGFALMGLGLELLQGWGGVRTMEFWDAAANAAGVGLGLYGAGSLVKFRNQ